MNMDSRYVSYKNITSNIFLTSVYVYPPPSKFLSVTCSVLLREECDILFYSHSSFIWSRVTHGISTGKKLDLQNTHEEKFWTRKIPTRQNFGPTKYQWGKISDPQNIHKKISWSHEIPTGNKLDPQNTHEKNLDPRNTHKEKFWIHECTVELDSRDYDGTRTTEFSTLIVWHTICFRLLTFLPAYGQL